MSDKPVSKEDFEKSLSPLQLKLFEKLPFALTDDQRSVINTINNEIDRGFMERNELLIKNTPDNSGNSNNATSPSSKLPFTMARLLRSFCRLRL